MRKGSKISEETRKKLSLAKKGKPSNWKGRTASLETRLKMSSSRKEYFLRINPNYRYDPRDKREIRKERIRLNGGSHSSGEWHNLKAQYNWRCPSCKREEPEIKLTKDHIRPVSRGGSDNIENIQPLCEMCNVNKNTKVIRF